MNALFTFLNALAAVHGSYLVCSGQWLVGTALIVVPLFSVYALALRAFPGIKQAGYFLNALLVIVGLAYTFYIMNHLAGDENGRSARRARLYARNLAYALAAGLAEPHRLAVMDAGKCHQA
jgi:hypothetical protein